VPMILKRSTTLSLKKTSAIPIIDINPRRGSSKPLQKKMISIVG